MWRASTSLPVPGFAADQHRGVGARHLLGATDGASITWSRTISAWDFAGRGLQDRGDQIRIGRQRQEFARAGLDGADGGLGVVAGAAGDDRHGHALGRQSGDDGADVVGDVAQHEIDVRIGSQPDQCAVGIVRLIELRAAADGDPGRLTQVAGERTDDQDFHRRGGREFPDPPGVFAT